MQLQPLINNRCTEDQAFVIHVFDLLVMSARIAILTDNFCQVLYMNKCNEDLWFSVS